MQKRRKNIHENIIGSIERKKLNMQFNIEKNILKKLENHNLNVPMELRLKNLNKC